MKKYMGVAFLALAVFLTACGGAEEKIDPNMSEEVNDFTFTTQDREELSLEDLKGEYWIADFIFTNCTSVCLPMTSNLAKLQQKTADEEMDLQFVSFSVDPEYDTPEVLKEYAKEYQANLDNWTFVTGYDFETIKEFSIKSFKSMVAPPPEGNDQVTHGTSFFLINPEGKVIKKYNGVLADSIDTIFADLKKLGL
ncbi:MULTISPECIES: SCO family protein [Clostridia]|uniref:SCO family protein n=1 Tax=Clostridia TaxID=186801 RepID=UPI000EA3A1B6|nr:MULTISPECIES: SCO family protein [Clostridia]NBJ68178.1 SCO family protein [Roseburia sp. 1XD42-34]RKI81951.1 SCO family protein [Clostridium sp. 1xD42-85]